MWYGGKIESALKDLDEITLNFEEKILNERLQDLDKELNTIEQEAAAKGIIFDSTKMSEGLNDVPLYKNNSDEI